MACSQHLADRAITLPTALGIFSVSLLATDNTGVNPARWFWTLAISGVPSIAYTSWSLFLAFANGLTQDISGLVQIAPPPAQLAYLSLPGALLRLARFR